MSKYFVQDDMISRFDFMNNQEFLPLQTACNLLNKQDEQYEELKNKYLELKKTFPKYKLDQWIYTINKNTNDIMELEIEAVVVTHNGFMYMTWQLEDVYFNEEDCYATREEAEAKLKEIKDGKHQ